jgi:hypothetical protein
MTRKPGDHERPPTPQQLAAYADGELDGGDRLRVAAWLAAHPDAAEEVASLYRLRDVWKATAPPEPADEAWAAAGARFEGIPAPAAARPSAWPLLGWAAGAAAVAAAAVLWMVLSQSGPAPVDAPAPPAVAAEPPFPVATEDEIVILRVGGADTRSLAVGTLPLQEPIQLAGPGEVTFTNVRPAPSDNAMPVVPENEHESPMVWARLNP